MSTSTKTFNCSTVCQMWGFGTMRWDFFTYYLSFPRILFVRSIDKINKTRQDNGMPTCSASVNKELWSWHLGGFRNFFSTLEHHQVITLTFKSFWQLFPHDMHAPLTQSDRGAGREGRVWSEWQDKLTLYHTRLFSFFLFFFLLLWFDAAAHRIWKETVTATGISSFTRSISPHFKFTSEQKEDLCTRKGWSKTKGHNVQETHPQTNISMWTLTSTWTNQWGGSSCTEHSILLSYWEEGGAAGPGRHSEPTGTKSGQWESHPDLTRTESQITICLRWLYSLHSTQHPLTWEPRFG